MFSTLAGLLLFAPLPQDPPRPEVAPPAGAVLQEPAAEKEPASGDPVEAVLPRLVQLMRDGLDVPEPNTSFTQRLERKTIFSGSYDWHSCVIAHWALLVHGRKTDNTELRNWVIARLGADALEYESESLILRGDKPGQTWPYDEAWFLMLLSELGRHPAEHRHDPSRQLELRKLHEARLLKALAERPFPERTSRKDKTQHRFVGHYGSWLWTYLLVRWSEPITEPAAAQLDALARDRIAPGRVLFEAPEKAFEPHPYDFLYVPALFALESGDPEAAYSPGQLDPWPAEVSLRDVHILGRELCRLWPNAAAHDEAYTDRVSSLLAREDLWAGDFTVVSHWVPQYLFLGHWFYGGRN